MSPAPRAQDALPLSTKMERGPGGEVSRIARFGLVAALLASLALAAACGRPPGPRGWAAARPVSVQNEELVLVAHKKTLFALPQGSSNPGWQFPPKDRDAYSLSEQRRAELAAQVDALDVSADEKSRLNAAVDDLHVSGPSGKTLKDAINGSSASSDAKKQLASDVDEAMRDEKTALTQVTALYGNIAVSDDGTTAYFGGFGSWFYAVDTQSGDTRWIHNLDGGVIGGAAFDAARDTVYVGTKGSRLYALDAATGDERWIFKTSGEVWSAPTLDGDAIYATSLDGTVYKLNTSGGEEWRFGDAGSGIASEAIPDNGRVFVGSFDNKLYALDQNDGTMAWSVSADNWFWATPLVRDGVVYAASLDGKVYAVSEDSGEARWDQPFDTGSPVRSSPTFAGGGLLVASRDGDVYKLDVQTGQPIDGSPGVTDQTVEADLTSDQKDRVYVVPRSATLFIVDAAGTVAVTSFALPQ